MSKRTIEATHVAGLPQSPPGWYDTAYAITGTGLLAVLRSEIDVLAAWSSISGGAASPIPEKTCSRLSLFDGAEETAAIEFPCDGARHFDRLPNGNWAVAGYNPDGANLRIFAPNGRLVRQFDIGGPFDHVQTARDGGIWVGYRDEAWGGTVKFNDAGAVLWRGTRPFHCYALNVCREQTWTYGYTDFSIIGIDLALHERSRRCSVKFADALAVDGDMAILAGGYLGDEDRIVLVKLEKGLGRIVAKLKLDVGPDGESGRPRLLMGREDAIHFSRRGDWYRLRVADVTRSLVLKRARQRLQ